MTIQWVIIRALLFVLVVGGAACSSDSPSQPTSPFEGEWSGAMADNALGQVPISLELADSPAGASGEWSATVAGQVVNGTLLAVSTIEAGSARHLISAGCSGGAGFWSLTATFSGSRMTGSYGAFSCSGLTSGTLEVVKK
jgi:hypothetical protein